MIVYDEKVPIDLWRNAIVPGVLLSRDSEIRGAIVRIAKTNTNLERLVIKLFTAEINIMILTKQIRQESQRLGEKQP